MKSVFTLIAAGLLAVSFTVSADAATKREIRKEHVSHAASCKAQAAKKFSAIHFMKRRAFEKRCMGEKA
jgi:hypothetical protein